MLLDSNIIIYAAQPEHDALRKFIFEHSLAVSVISYIEVLGYHRLEETERRHFEQFFKAAEVIPLSDAIAVQAIKLKQQRRMSLGDSLVAATAIACRKRLVTHNAKDSGNGTAQSRPTTPNYGGECSRKALLKIVTMPALWINTMIPRRAMIRVKTIIYGKDSKTRTCRFDGWIRKRRSFCLASYEVRSWKENPWNRTGKLFASASRSGANVT